MMRSNRLFDEPRKVLARAAARSGGLNDVPSIEHIVQRTERAVYLLARGVGSSLAQKSAEAASKWFSRNKGLTIDRDGPSRFPGPDGTQYEWFFRISAIDGAAPVVADLLYAAVVERLRRTVPATPLTAPDIGDLEHTALTLEKVRADTFLVERLHALERARARDQRTHLIALRQKSRKETPQSTAERETIDGWVKELVHQDEKSRARVAELDAREQRLVGREALVAAERERLDRRASGASQLLDVSATRRLFPRLQLAGETIEILQFELPDNSAYLRLLGALQDGVPMTKESYPPVMKHVKVHEVRGNELWEVRLKDSVAKKHRLFHRSLIGEKIEIHLVYRRDTKRFFASLR